MKTWCQNKFKSYCICVWCESGELGGRVQELGGRRSSRYKNDCFFFKLADVIMMVFRVNMYHVNMIHILILIMILCSYTKCLNDIKTDGLNTEEVYGLCLLGEKNFCLLHMRVPKLPRKSLIFLFFLIRRDIELWPGPHVQESLTDVSKLRGIKLFHQNIRGLFSKKDILETLFTNKKFIITLSATHIASVNSELFQIPEFKFVHKNRIARRVEELRCIYLII